jgi:hypothetical protein
LFLGSVDRETMEELHSNCYAFILPSAMEGQSISLMEAMSYGSCIVVSNIPENLEVTAAAALHVPFGAPRALTSVLRRLLDDPDLVRHCRAATRARTRAQFDWDEVTRRTEAFYHELMARSARRPARALAWGLRRPDSNPLSPLETNPLSPLGERVRVRGSSGSKPPSPRPSPSRIGSHTA